MSLSRDPIFPPRQDVNKPAARLDTCPCCEKAALSLISVMNVFSGSCRRLFFVVAAQLAFAAAQASLALADDAASPTARSLDSADSTVAAERASTDTQEKDDVPPSPPAAVTTIVGGSSASALGKPLPPPVPAASSEAAEKRDATTSRIVTRMLGEIRRTEGEPRRLSLAEAVRIAVENNPGIQSQAELPRRDAWTSYGATGAFDPKFRTNAHASSITAPSASALASGKTVFDEDAVRTGVSISKLLRSGAELDLAWNGQIVDTNSVFYQVNPRYDNRLILSLRQPLLRNFWARDEETTVLVARSRAAESLAAFEANLARFVQSVVDTYWRYLQAAADLEVARRSVALARELVRDAEAKVEVGLLAPVAVKEAQADAAAREDRAIRIENALTIAGSNLQHEVMLGAAGANAPEPVVPVEEHVVTPIELDREAILATAAEARAEIRGAAYALGRSRLEEKRAKNRTLPVLDFVAHYGLLGLSGDSKLLRDDLGNPIPDGAGGFLNASPYDGPYGDSWDDLFGGDYDDYAVGLELEVPIGNAEARAALAEAQIDVRRAARDLEQTVSTVALEVDRAIADVSSAAKRVVASKAARELAEENLRNQTRRFELGAVTTKDVLDFQEKLAQAQAAEVAAITDHARSVSLLRNADGTLLARFGIEIQSPDAPGTPWWYRF